jgi:hypothetical protein
MFCRPKCLAVDDLGLGGASEELPDDFNIGLWHIGLLFVSGRSNLLGFLSLISFQSLSSQRT